MGLLKYSVSYVKIWNEQNFAVSRLQ